MSGKAKEDRCTELHKATPKSSKVTYRDVLLVPFKKIRKDPPRRVDRSRSRHSKFCYTRAFLLSLSQLEVCKRLPCGFDPSTSCSESDASCTSLFDMQKILRTSLLSHESRVSRCGSSSAARGHSGNSSRGSSGKRDGHSRGWNNQDRGSKCDRDSALLIEMEFTHLWCGAKFIKVHLSSAVGVLIADRHSGDESHYGPRSQYFRQFPGDGLLGSGTSPNVFQCTAGTSAPKIEAQLQYELRKSDNPCRLPRSYKEVPKAGRGRDSYTKEAQISAESLNKERVEDKKPKGGTVTSKFDGFPISVAGDNILHLGDKYQSAVTSSRGIKSGNLLERTQVDNTQVNQSYDDDWAEIVSILLKEQESELSAIPEIAPNLPTVESELNPVPDSNDSASEYCLPDEDSLISFDDLIIPQHFVSNSGGSSSKDCMLPSNVKTEVSDKYLAQSVMHWDERSTVPGYYGVTSLEKLYHNQHSQLSYPQFCLPQTNPGRPSFQGLYSHQAQVNCQKKFSDPKTPCGASPLEPHFNARCRPSGSKAKSKKPDPFSCYSLLQQPTVFPHYQPNELYMAQVASLAQGLNRMEMRPSIYQQCTHDGFRLPNPVRNHRVCIDPVGSGSLSLNLVKEHLKGCRAVLPIPVVALDTAIKCRATISPRQIGSKAAMAGLNSLAKDIGGAIRSKLVLIVCFRIDKNNCFEVTVAFF
ncbi:hypothetical protein RHSIM_Rhsim03G0191400 [Rhododendron simsii]|uniref:Uncharacterized protein n=1 Tax=Rhododendron simsii TaxID=118357 RepID=A0A834H8H0_RHOSS|nr:hypothetical protein RHSIM_Rhsim03G0191400 [Rhododendron simsii]